MGLAYIPMTDGIAGRDPDEFDEESFGAIEEGKNCKELAWFFVSTEFPKQKE